MLEEIKTYLGYQSDIRCKGVGRTHYIGCPCSILKAIEVLEKEKRVLEDALWWASWEKRGLASQTTRDDHEAIMADYRQEWVDKANEGTLRGTVIGTARRSTNDDLGLGLHQEDAGAQ